MTSGSSQGLFVIVAVVIFGIFVVISYLLFRDKLQTGLASIFNESITEVKEKSIDYKDGSDIVQGNFTSKVEKDNKEFTVYKQASTPSGNWGSETPIGLSFKQNIEVPYGYKLLVKFEINVEKEARYYYDLNGYNKDNPSGFIGTHTTSYGDNYGDIVSKNVNAILKKNTWTLCEYGYVNNSKNNTLKVAIHDSTYFGIRYSDLEGINSFKIRNVEYKLVNMD